MRDGRLVSSSGAAPAPVFGTDEWVRAVLPTLTDEEAYRAVERMVAEGLPAEEVPAQIYPHLPRLGNPLRQGSIERPDGDEEPGDLWERLSGTGWPSLPEAAAGCSFACGASSLGAMGFDPILITAGPAGVKITLSLFETDPLTADGVAAQIDGPDQFALLTGRFADGPGEVHALLGCPTSRRDALSRRVARRAGILHAGPWVEVESGRATEFLDAIMSRLGAR